MAGRVTGETLSVTGYKEFLKACKYAPADVRHEVRAALRQVGEAVRADATRRFSAVDARSAAGYRVSVTQQGVAVYQSIRKTTGKRGDYGALQMKKGLLPAQRAELPETERSLENALGRVADIFETR